jgi:hypothetical protein
LHSRFVRSAGAFLLTLAALAMAGHSTAADRELADSSDFRVRVQAALRLGRTGGAQARADLETGLRDAHPAVRVACAVALGTLGDTGSAPALQQAMRSETSASVRASMNDNLEKLRAPPVVAAAASAGGDASGGVERAKYIVQIGTMRNATGQRADLDSIMRSSARAKGGSIKGALILDNPDAAILRRATERKIPVLLVDANLTRLSQTVAKDGGVVISAQVDLSIRRVPQQTLRGMVSGSASASDDARAFHKGLTELQNRAVNGAVESAMSSVGSEIAALAK